MKSDTTQPSTPLLPVAITAVIAAIGVAGMAYAFFAAGQVSEGGIGMRSADAVYRAGATVTPTVSTPGSAVPSRSIKVADEARQDL